MKVAQARAYLNLALSIAVAALLLIVVLEPGKDHDQLPTLTELNVDDVAAIHITTRSEARHVMEKRADGWWITQPAQVPARSESIAEILSIASAPSMSQYQRSDVDLQQARLDDPVATLRFGETEIRFGNRAPIEGYRYAMVGDTVHLIADRKFVVITSPLSALVALQPIPPNARLTGLTVRGYGHSPQHRDRLHVSGPVNPSAARRKAWKSVSAAMVRPLIARSQAPMGRITFLEPSTNKSVELLLFADDEERSLVASRPDAGLDYYLSAQESALLLADDVASTQ